MTVHLWVTLMEEVKLPMQARGSKLVLLFLI